MCVLCKNLELWSGMFGVWIFLFKGVGKCNVVVVFGLVF